MTEVTVTDWRCQYLDSADVQRKLVKEKNNRKSYIAVQPHHNMNTQLKTHRPANNKAQRSLSQYRLHLRVRRQVRLRLQATPHRGHAPQCARMEKKEKERKASAVFSESKGQK